MKQKEYSLNENLSRGLGSGISKLENLVSSTLGPSGKTVIISKIDQLPIITKDGVTVANNVTFNDPIENLAATIIKEVANKTNTEAGDGTTTSTVLAAALYSEAQKYISSGINVYDVKRGINKSIEVAINFIVDGSKVVSTVEEIKNVATISANGDNTIGELIAKAVSLIGEDGSIMVEEARSVDTSLDLTEGFKIDAGYAAAAFVNNKKKHVVQYDNALVFVTDKKVDSVKDCLPVLELAARDNKPLIICAEEVSGQALAALIMNTVRGTMKVAAIRSPRYGEERRNIMKDLALATGATYFSMETDHRIENITLNDLGVVKGVEIGKSHTTFIDGSSDYLHVDERIEELKAELNQTENLNDCKIIQERISRLSSGVAVIKIGGSSDIEVMEKKHRVEDALEAVRSAHSDGIVPGCGLMLLRASLKLQELNIEDLNLNGDESVGLKIVSDALQAPFRKIILNSGNSPDVVMSKVVDNGSEFGYNAKTGEYVENMFDAGIVDPAKVVMCAIKNASSVVSTLLTSDSAIVEI